MYKIESSTDPLEQSLQGNLCCQCPHCVCFGGFTSYQLLSGSLLPWAESTSFGCSFIPKRCGLCSPRMHHSMSQTQHMGTGRGPPTNHTLHQTTCELSTADAPLLFIMFQPPASLCMFHCITLRTSPSAEAFRGTEITWQCDSCHLNWNHPLSPC